MVEYKVPSASSASSGSADSHEVETPSGRYNPANHGYTIGLPNSALRPHSTNGNGRESLRPATPTKSIEIQGWPRLLQSPLPVPGAWLLSPMRSPPAALQAVAQVPTPPVAFPPTSPHPNRIATAPELVDEVHTALTRVGIVRSVPITLPQRLQRPVGKPYSGPRVTMAPRGVPTSPQRIGVERSWTTWWYDGATRNFIPAVATEIVGDPEDVNWENLIYLLHVTSHAHIVRLLDGSHLPKRDAQSGAFVQYDGQLVEKSLTDRGQLAGWNEQQWKRQRLRWRANGIWSEPDVVPGVFPHPFQLWERIDGKPLSMILKKRPDGVEEAFIWYFLLSLLDAVRWLHHGLPDQPHPGESDWRAVIHNNINPDSIWLNRPLTPDVRYGTLKLGNFSRAVILDRRASESSGSSLRKERFHLEGQPRRQQHEHFDAPELSWMVDTDPEEASILQEADARSEEAPTACSPIAGKSDVWSIGAVAVALMGGIWIDPGDTSLERWRRVSREKTFVLQTIQLYQMGGKRWGDALLPPNYSHTLRVVLEKMLTLDPKERVDALQAHTLVTEGYDNWLETRDHVPDSKGEDDAIDSDPNDSDDDHVPTTRPPRLRDCPCNRQPPHGSDENDDWRPKYREPRDDQSRSPPRHKSASDRPFIVRKQNAGPRRDPTRYTISGQPRFSSTSGLVRVKAGYQRPDRPANPFPPTRPSRSFTGTTGRPSWSKKPATGSTPAAAQPVSPRQPSLTAPATPFSFRLPPADNFINSLISISSGQSSTSLPSSNGTPPPRQSPAAPATPFGFRPPRANNSIVPGFSPISISSGESSSSAPPSPPKRKTPPRQTTVSRPSRREQRVRFNPPGSPRGSNAMSHTTETGHAPKRLRIVSREELRANVQRNYVSVQRNYVPVHHHRHAYHQREVESLAKKEQEQGRWMCNVQ